MPEPEAAAPPELARTQVPTLDATLPGTGGSTTAAATVPDTTRYEVLDALGRGGMGEVLLCHDRRVGREVALKVATTGAHPRFLREALLAARLEHPAFVPVYDVRIDEAGIPSFTMRRIRGRTLRAVLDARAAGQADVRAEHTRHRLLAGLAGIALALDYAHSRGVVHRDVKPDNVMFGDFGEVYLLDWGVAKIMGEPDAAYTDAEVALSGERAPGTAAGAILGTPGYMAPEQWRGDTDAIGPHTDVYALGALLFEIVAEEPLNRGETLHDLCRVTLAGADRSPLARALGRDVPPELDAVCQRATHPDPAQRYPSARALANALEHFLDGDRDAALRRARATELARGAAEDHAAAGGDPERKAAAGRRAVQALAFDPENEDARRTLSLVLSEPPAEIPDEARESAAHSRDAAERTLLRWTSGTLLIVCVTLAVALVATGLIDRTLFWAVLASGFSATGILALAPRMRAHEGALVTAGFAVLAFANVLFARWAGPFIAVPLMMVVNTTAMTFFGSGRERLVRAGLGTLAVVVPVLLDEAGVWAPSYHVTAEGLSIVPRLAHFGPWMPWTLMFLHAGVVLATPLLLSYALESARAIELRFHAQAWVLRRVVALGSERPTV